MPAIASVPDLLRLLVIPFFGYVAWRDIATRRVPNRTWIPLAVLAVVLLVWEFYVVMTGDLAAFQQQRFYIRVAISIGFIIPLTYLFWLIGGFGGADAKAFFVIAVLFPTYPDYALAELGVGGALGSLPVVQTAVGVFSLTILSNTVLAGAAYPLLLAGKNAVTGYVSPGMFVAKPIQAEEAIVEYGTLLDFPDRRFIDDLSLGGMSSYFSWRRLDLDALRMYLQWRGLSLEELRADPEQYRDPTTLPDEPNPPGDGMIETDGGQPVDSEKTVESDTDGEYDDPWGAEAFLDDIEGSAYGTTPEGLQEGLDTLSEDEVVWISPGIPFLVPLFLGVVVSFTYGDLLFAFLEAIGFA
ncbi:A24 family peptidase [Halovenus sp. HT40]|uniref:A24 family peptidase n=1 Tax=Halovenus sp. HT40 TaxID=3126691 RepID=UPI00300EF8AB